MSDRNIGQQGSGNRGGGGILVVGRWMELKTLKGDTETEAKTSVAVTSNAKCHFDTFSFLC